MTHSYMSESQAFFLLSILCDRLLPGYYSQTMYGTLLDQRVFESLVEKTMPILWDHLVKADVQLSVVSLPWFLSLYINSMPLVFAFRVLDVFFLEGPKVLFQVGLAILRINGEELLDAADDGAFIQILKSYFSRLDESAHPRSENEKLRAVTRFQELMVVAFKEFAGITQQTISEQRAKHKDTVLNNIENFAKRTSIRNLGPESKRLSVDDLGALYDRFYGVLYERQQRLAVIKEETDKRARASKSKANQLVTGSVGDDHVEKGRVGMGPSPTLMDYDAFREFLAGIAKWAITDSPTSPVKSPTDESHSYFGSSMRSRPVDMSPWGAGNPQPADHEFMQRLFRKWHVDGMDGLSLQNVVTGLAHVKGTRDIMSSISYFFELYDDNGDGKIDREGILKISEALLFLSRRGLEGGASHTSIGTNGADSSSTHSDERSGSAEEKFLSSVSAFIRRCFEYADPDHPANQDDSASQSTTLVDESLNNFSIGDESDEGDLLDFGKEQTLSPKKSRPTLPDANSTESQTSAARSRNVSANLALDPANPLHITLPTFRMVILADELLERFFEFSFPASFHLSGSKATGIGGLSSPSTLTTFSNLGFGPRISPVPTGIPSPGLGGLAGAGSAGGKGLRGVLDGIVNDGMRVAAEVKRRMDEAQKELEKNALAAGNAVPTGEEEEDEEEIRAAAAGDDRRSIKDADQDLLGGVEAEVGSMKSGVEGMGRSGSAGSLLGPVTEEPKRDRSASTATEKIVEFER
jgi:TBC1 domain family member 8/9